MAYYCEVCDIFIKVKSKDRHFKWNTHKELDECKHKKFTITNPDMNDIDNTFYESIIQHDEKYDYYFIECEFKLCFNDNQYCPYITSKLSDNKTMCSCQIFSVKPNNDF